MKAKYAARKASNTPMPPRSAAIPSFAMALRYERSKAAARESVSVLKGSNAESDPSPFESGTLRRLEDTEPRLTHFRQQQRIEIQSAALVMLEHGHTKQN